MKRNNPNWTVGRIAAAFLLPALWLTAGCDETSVEPLEDVATIQVAVADLSIGELATTQATATLLTSSGEAIAGTVAWSSENPEIATVDANGVVKGIRGGSVRIIATSGEHSGHAIVTVEEYVRSITIEPGTLPELPVGGMTNITATARCGNGHVMVRQVRFTTSDPSVVAVHASGLVTAIGPGTAEIRASTDDIVNTVEVNVGAPVARIMVEPNRQTLDVGQTLQFSAKLFDANGLALQRAVTWTVDAAAVGVDANGLVTGVESGMARVIARAEGIRGAAVIDVRDPVGVIELEPTDLVLRIGDVVPIQTRILGASGLLLTRSLQWHSSNSAVAEVSDGVVKAMSPGTAKIDAIVEGRSASVAVKVEKPIARLALRDTIVDVAVNGYVQLVIEAWDEDGAIIHPHWKYTSANEDIAKMAVTGMVWGIHEGTTTVTGSAEGYSLTALVRVYAAALPYTVAMSPKRHEMLVGDWFVPTVVVRDALNRIVLLPLHWKSSNSEIASVDEHGKIVGHSPGAVKVTVEVGGHTDWIEIVVKAPPPVPQTVTIIPRVNHMIVGERRELQAVCLDAQGQQLNLPITWRAKKAGVVVLTPKGVAEAIGVGDVAIEADCQGVIGKGEIVVHSLPPVAHKVTIAPMRYEMGVGERLVLNATVQNEGGDVLDMPVLWRLLKEGVVVISPTGVVEAIAPGRVVVEAACEHAKGTAEIIVHPRVDEGEGW